MVSLRLFAGTNIGLRDNNEDNFIVCPDLTENEWIVPADSQQVIQLGSRGCVMVVADGMGGQNAGEVASAIAIDTVQKMFSPDLISLDMCSKPDAIKSFMKKVISECDIRIKKRAQVDPSTDGMGSTIVIAWLIGQKLYIAWLGDSRAYSYVNSKGIARLSKDHSYVQQLVDAGAITDEEAMDHPNSNVITRSLGDNSQKAKADVAEYDVEDGEIVLLCSDGLCGVCRDEEIGGIIEESADNLQKCKEQLTKAALAAGGSDNITIALMQIHIDSAETTDAKQNGSKSRKIKWPLILIPVFGLCVLLAVVSAVFLIDKKPDIPVVKSVKIWLDKNSLSPGEHTHYHIEVIGDSVDTLEFDKNLIAVNYKDSIIIVKKRDMRIDGPTKIKVICKHDPSLVGSVSLNIIKLPTDRQKEENPSSSEPKSVSKDNNIDNSKNEQGGVSGLNKSIVNDSLTPSTGNVDIITQ